MAESEFIQDTDPTLRATVWKPEEECLAPEVSFIADAYIGDAPLTITFTDTSTEDPTSWAWNFGDGSTSTEQNPTHEFVDPGTYIVTLVAVNECGSSTNTTITVEAVLECITDVTFTAEPLVGTAPLEVQFTDTSGGTPISWLWDFGDGDTSTEQNPLHTYVADGLYDVSLEITDACGTVSLLKVEYIEIDTAVLPLDGWSATIVYALARLITLYTGPLVRVRNSVTDVETDIPYVVGTNLLDLTALTAAGGANSLFVVTWYDQSGNAYHATNSDKTKQPKIYNAGTFLGWVASDGSNDFLESPSVPFSTTVICVITDGKECETFVRGKLAWKVGGANYFHSFADGVSDRMLYGQRLSYYMAVDSTNTADKTRVANTDVTLNVSSYLQNDVFQDNVQVTESYTTGSSTAHYATGTVQLFGNNVVGFCAKSELRAWILLLDQNLDSTERIYFGTLTYAP